MRGFRLAVTFAVAAVLAAGCGPVVAGTAKPAPNLKPKPLSGKVVEHVLLSGKTLTRMLGQPFVGRQPAQFGGPEKLDRREAPPESTDCLGVTAMLQKSVYDSDNITNVASVSWWNDGDPAQVISVMEGVVALPSAAEAQELFTKISGKWPQCKGQTTTEEAGPITTTTVIDDVRTLDSVVAASNTATATLPNMPSLTPTPQARAIGVRLNCIVEVDMVFFGERTPQDPGSAKPDVSAIDVAHAMMEKVSNLS
ncbi:sensor domain-containing protein [Candidatus Mycobacterium wuenschmannii]|uniref:Sensor domain-containing protein n=1 Tax=Candidatus Mycobacterium wuenschmannii TaxID=3027808 RepID=A0ABY8W0N9_9MYCO|nr:sensor domain-containing protein [Candidatus Mycobacterium wuenschmannii]WIM89428.1 sensor domain-containing protein [Candidatus Mycobacterium wuenschmannii]